MIAAHPSLHAQDVGTTGCPVAKPHTPTDAEQEFLGGRFEHSVELYRESLRRTPGDPRLTVGLARSLMRLQKIAEAEAILTQATARDGDSALLFTELGEVQYREGRPWLADASVDAALRLDACVGRAHLLKSRLSRLESNDATGAAELKMARKLDPVDPEIRRRWLNSLSLAHHIAELEKYLASDTGDDEQELAHLRGSLASLKKRLADPHPPCRMISGSKSTELSMVAINANGSRTTVVGLSVELDHHESRLQLSTGSAGLSISRDMAESAHLTPYTAGVTIGVGDNGETSNYRSTVDSIRIGEFEFQNCEVTVSDQPSLPGTDGSIGTAVFSNFLMTLDMPMRRLRLRPLPLRPSDPDPEKPALETAKSSSPSDEPEPLPGDAPAKSGATTALTKPARKPRVRYDRYIAPEMKDWTQAYNVNHMLLVPTRLNDGEPRLFAVETGSSQTTVSPEAAETATKLHLDKKLTSREAEDGLLRSTGRRS